MSNIDKKNKKDTKSTDKKTKKELDKMNIEISNEIVPSKHSKKAKKIYI